jgi:aminoglycoside phosphotransferase (APT) family kinase protein
MHPDEVAVPAELVRGLLADQFPEWADLPLAPVPSYGTDNVLYRLGDELLMRLPKIEWATGQIDLERELLPRLAPHLAVEVPRVVAVGEPGHDYPWRWAVYRWLEGDPPRSGTRELADDLASFLAALQRIDTTGARVGRSRGGPLLLRDAETRKALGQLEGEIDVAAATTAWEAALDTPPWPYDPVWLHGDLLEGNLLVRDGRLSGVIDWGAAAAGDPAFDYHIAWSLLAPVRDEFRAACGVDDDTWARARGLALSQALIALPYYLHTSPPIVARSRFVIEQVLA